MNAAAPPGFDAFRAAWDAGRGTLIWRTGLADLETPVAAFLKLAHGRANSCLLESIEGGAARGRYSVIGMEPDLIWRCRGGRPEINRHARSAPHAFAPDERPALDSLRALIAEARLDIPEGLPPMSGGLVGYLGYDMVRQMERLPEKNADALGLPEAILVRPTLFAIFDNVRDELILAAPVYHRAETAAEQAWAQAQAALDAAQAALDRPLPHPPPPVTLPDMPAPASNFSKAGFKQAVLRGKDYIAAGDAFQIVLSQRFSVPFALPPFALYRALRRINPAPYLFYLDFGGFAVVGSSPEILVRLQGGTVTIRPLAGTRRRGATHEEDQALEAELLADPKERAEHLMLLDLGRNDVGRVAEIGSVRVTESFAIERFSHVMHIMSDVQGRIRPELDAVDALAAGFPAGTLSGAPKVRAMEIIEELEPTRRGIYAGCIGYFAAGGTMDTCIALRTAVVKDGTMYVQAGCGVVADSDPEAEYEETRQKARALFRAAEEAVRFAAGKPRPGVIALFTVGYEKTSQADVIATLLDAGVSRLIDVRDRALSRRAGFSKRQLQAGIEAAGLRYVHLRALGTPPEGREAHRRRDWPPFWAIVEAKLHTAEAELDLQRAADLAAEAPSCLLCYCGDWRTCHRKRVAELLCDRAAFTARHLAPRRQDL